MGVVVEEPCPGDREDGCETAVAGSRAGREEEAVQYQPDQVGSAGVGGQNSTMARKRLCR